MGKIYLEKVCCDYRHLCHSEYGQPCYFKTDEAKKGCFGILESCIGIVFVKVPKEKAKGKKTRKFKMKKNI